MSVLHFGAVVQGMAGKSGEMLHSHCQIIGHLILSRVYTVQCVAGSGVTGVSAHCTSVPRSFSCSVHHASMSPLALPPLPLPPLLFLNSNLSDLPCHIYLSSLPTFSTPPLLSNPPLLPPSHPPPPPPPYQEICAAMRKVVARQPQLEQRHLHRRVFVERVDLEMQAIMVRGGGS